MNARKEVTDMVEDVKSVLVESAQLVNPDHEDSIDLNIIGSWGVHEVEVTPSLDSPNARTRIRLIKTT
jgi:hypothetical protein